MIKMISGLKENLDKPIKMLYVIYGSLYPHLSENIFLGFYIKPFVT